LVGAPAAATVTGVRNRSTTLTVLFYTSLTAVVAAVLLQALPLLLPEALAVRIGHNSEGLVLALLLAAWIQFARPRLAGDDRAGRWTALVAAACVVLAVALLLSDLPSRFRTLNETFLAAAILIPYLQWRRPLPYRLAVWLPLAVLAATVAFNRTAPVTNLAETLGVLLLAPIAFDLVDRAVLDERAHTSRPVRWAWYVLLVVAPVVFSVLQYGIGVDGLAGEAVRYAVRITEAFVALLLIELYFAVGHGRTGRPAPAVAAARPDEPVAIAR